MTFYVRMTDKFMSGWGAAANRKNVLVVECDDYEQAVAIEKAAKARPEMRRVKIVSSPPRARYGGPLISRRHFSEMGGPWLDFYGTKVVRSLMSGKEVVIRKDTPLCCDPSSETYWSM